MTHQVSFVPLKRPCSYSGQIEFFEEVERCETDDIVDWRDLFDFPDCWKSEPFHFGYFFQIKKIDRFLVKWAKS